MTTCNEKSPYFAGQHKCNRPVNHPGDHCRFLLDVTGYHNIWWTNVDRTDPYKTPKEVKP